MILENPAPLDIILTTYATDTLYTQACLESIRPWKQAHHHLHVVTHDETPLLRAYLEACAAGPTPLIDDLALAEPRHGHTRSFNLGVSRSASDVVFNIANDICIGPSLIDDCAWKLHHDPALGLIGWHWYNEGTFWQGDKIAAHMLRDAKKPDLGPQEVAAIRNAKWLTGGLGVFRSRMFAA